MIRMIIIVCLVLWAYHAVTSRDKVIADLQSKLAYQADVATLCVNWYFNNPSTSLVDAKARICRK